MSQEEPAGPSAPVFRLIEYEGPVKLLFLLQTPTPSSYQILGLQCNAKRKGGRTSLEKKLLRKALDSRFQ